MISSFQIWMNRGMTDWNQDIEGLKRNINPLPTVSLFYKPDGLLSSTAKFQGLFAKASWYLIFSYFSDYHEIQHLWPSKICFAISNLKIRLLFCVAVQSLSHFWLFCDPRLLCSWDFPGKNTRVGRHFLLQGIFPAQGLNPCLLHWQANSSPLSHLGSPKVRLGPNNQCCLEWYDP